MALVNMVCKSMVDGGATKRERSMAHITVRDMKNITGIPTTMNSTIKNHLTITEFTTMIYITMAKMAVITTMVTLTMVIMNIMTVRLIAITIGNAISIIGSFSNAHND
ncbi:hypothetical protein KIN20_007254 [Parelaphostrongylus tenuis]|uniref:Uncharacterized protein n=1 Tax=Parelaphostrongylus tenuis TaxID=148309 RepID=A0AAD5M7S1_PARTN|nr:hypothetical protein KIN20_007254 [Parelaphostrongylus tenuis]